MNHALRGNSGNHNNNGHGSQHQRVIVRVRTYLFCHYQGSQKKYHLCHHMIITMMMKEQCPPEINHQRRMNINITMQHYIHFFLLFLLQENTSVLMPRDPFVHKKHECVIMAHCTYNVIVQHMDNVFYSSQIFKVPGEVKEIGELLSLNIFISSRKKKIQQQSRRFFWLICSHKKWGTKEIHFHSLILDTWDEPRS